MFVYGGTILSNIIRLSAEEFTDYNLITLNEEEIPLAGGLSDNTNMYPAAVIAICVMLILIVVMLYLIRCHIYQKRIRELAEKTDCERYAGYNLVHLKESLSELEAEVAGIAINF